MQSKDRAKNKSRWGFSFKQLLVVYLLGIVAIVAVAWYWPKYKQNMEKEHNAKAKQLLGYNPTDKDLIKLSELTYITKLNLGMGPLTRTATIMVGLRVVGKPKISDAGLVHLKSLHLKELNLFDTKISDAGLAELKKALPNCEIWH